MRIKLLTAVSVIALTSATAANASTSGSLSVGISWGQETAGMHSHFFIKNISGQLEFALDDRWSTQIEVFAAESGANHNNWFGKFDDEMGLSTYGGTAHVNTDVMDDLKVGGFMMFEETTVGDSGYADEGAGGNLYMAVGGEARWAVSSAFSITGQLGGLFHLDNPGVSGTPNCNSLCNAFFARVGATWFFDPNDAVSAGAGYLTGSGGAAWNCCSFTPVGETGWNYGVSVRHQFDDSPFAVYAGYNGMTISYLGFTQTDNVLSAGVTYFFGGDTLERQHNAGGFSTPHFERQINLSLSADDVSF